MDKCDSNVAVISMYNILEINYNLMLVHFLESRHDLQLEDVSTQKDLLRSVNVGQSCNSKIPCRQIQAHTSELSHGSQK